jgi:hypothetical protein
VQRVHSAHREDAIRLLAAVESFARAEQYEIALALCERVMYLLDAHDADRLARLRRGLLMLRTIAWLTLALVLAGGVLLASR